MENKIVNIDRIIMFNDENGFIVFKGREFNTDNEIIVKGYAFDLNEDDLVECNGKWVKHFKFGTQLEASEIFMYTPKTSESILIYLKKGYISGIGEKTAERIYELFGDNSIEILDNNPEELRKVKGIGKKTLTKIINDWNEKRTQHKLNEQLKELGFSFEESLSIIKKYRSDSIEVVCKNPYSLLLDYDLKLTFKKIDKIALSLLKYEKEDPTRILTFFILLLRKNEKKGHTYIEKTKLISDSYILRVSNDLLELVYEAGINYKKIYNFKTKKNIEIVQLYTTHLIEKGVSEKLKSILLKNQDLIYSIDDKISLFERNDFKLSSEQKNAIKESINKKINIINGGPGVGKTTTLDILIKILKMENKSFLLCAQTGKAAQRMSESTGEEAATIHRTLEYNPQYNTFQRDQFNNLEADFIIIDEASMIDIFLFDKLIKAINDKSFLIIIGDVNQIPSIEAGCVLKDLIESKRIPVSSITKIQRQSSDSSIIKNAYLINEGKKLDLTTNKKKDFFFIKTKNDESTLEKISEMIKENIPKAFKVDPKKEVQILTANHKGAVGRMNLNTEIQKILNKKESKFTMKRGDVVFKENDNVIQVKNNYDKNVFNGDSGVITDVFNKSISIDFFDKEVIHERTELDEIELSYAITIHKSQGSEYPITIIPISHTNSLIFDRSLLYTAITRGKSIVIVIGSEISLNKIIANEFSRNRQTNLKEMLEKTIFFDSL